MKGSQIGIAVIGSGRIGTLRAQLAAKHPAVNFLAVPAHDRDLMMTMHADRNTVPLVDTVDRLATQRQPLSAEQMVRLHWLSHGWLIFVCCKVLIHVK